MIRLTPLQPDNRRGVAAVEFAVILPLMVLIAFGSMQVGQLVLIRNKSLATLEAASVEYSIGVTSESDLASRLRQVAISSGLSNPQVTVTSIGNTALQLELTIPVASNSHAPRIIQLAESVRKTLVVYRKDSNR